MKIIGFLQRFIFCVKYLKKVTEKLLGYLLKGKPILKSVTKKKIQNISLFRS